MSADVGGRLEAVPPRRSLYGRDYWRIGILLAIAAVVHTWLVIHTAVPARDAIGFARIANNLSDPNAGNPTTDQPRPRIEIVRTAHQHPGFPLVIWVAEKVLREAIPSRAERTLLATQIVNSVAAVLLVVPMYLIGRILFGRNVGFAAALLFQVLPVPARVTSDGLSEGLYLLVTTGAILQGVRAARRPGIGGFLLCGIATGASYLVRPEGLLVAIGVGAVIVLAWVSRKWSRADSLGRLCALGVGVGLAAAPYMLAIGAISTKQTPRALDPTNNETPLIWKNQPGTKFAAGSPPLFAVWWDPARDEGKNRFLWALGAVWGEVIKSLYYVVGGLALFGVVAHRRQILAPDRGLWVLLAVGTLNVLLLVYLATRIGYVSERHTVLFVMLACIFAAAALEPLALVAGSLPLVGRLVVWPKAAPGGILLAVVAAALPVTLQTMHPHREGHKHAGLWLADRLGPNDWLKDPLAWGEWYAGRTLYNPPVYHGRPDTIWVIVEKGKGSPHSRLPQWEEATRLVANHQPVYRWPEAATDDTPRVEVYKLRYEDVHLPPPVRGIVP